MRLACSWGLQAGREAVIAAEFYGTEGGASLRNVNGSFYDLRAERHHHIRAKPLAEPPDDWGGRAAVDWLTQLAQGARFDDGAQHLVTVAKVIDSEGQWNTYEITVDEPKVYVRLNGWLVNPGQPRAVVYFGGNAERIEAMRDEFARWFPDSSVYLVPYRGFGASEGDAYVDATDPGADGLCMLPFFNGERTPDRPRGKGLLAGLDPSNMSPAHLYRALQDRYGNYFEGSMGAAAIQKRTCTARRWKARPTASSTASMRSCGPACASTGSC